MFESQKGFDYLYIYSYIHIFSSSLIHAELPFVVMVLVIAQIKLIELGHAKRH